MQGYKKDGFSEVATGGVITLIIGVGVATLILIFVSSLGGQVWQQVEGDVDTITNTTIKSYIKESVADSFLALSKTGAYMPLIVLAVVIGLVLAIVLSLGGAGRGQPELSYFP